MEKMTDREVEVMMAIWDMPDGTATTGDILKHIAKYRNPFQTLHMVLNRLCEKGFLDCRRAKPANHYHALISREKYLEFANQNYIRYHFENSAKNLVFSLVRNEKLSQEDLTELQAVLDRKDGDMEENGPA